ncbi:MAG: hypothetical protein R3208_20735 [Ketobacteraceae bacterium]|nr:hypothetical protein [Ketobacteraceae bacterium]
MTESTHLDSTANTSKVVTLSPIRVHLGLKTGVNETTPGYDAFLGKLRQFEGVAAVPALERQKTRYESIETDVYDIRLMIWHFKDQDTATVAHFHIFPNSVAVVEVRLPPMDNRLEAGGLEKESQALSKGIIRRAYGKLYELFCRMSEELDPRIIRPISDLDVRPYDPERGPAILWVARTLILRPLYLKDSAVKRLVKAWLADTEKPGDAAEIIDRARDYSMTWLNYVLVEREPGCQQFRIDTMIIAQYYYAAQDLCNEQLKQAISNAYLKDRLMDVEQNLAKSRVAARLLEIAFHEHLKHLTRPKRKALEDILKSWDFEDMVKNNQRMVEVCSAKLQEANHQKRERSSLLTDLLLVSLSFFAVFELSLFLTQFSREMMSRPALDYQDETSSFFLSKIAYIDADIMILLGIVMTVALVLVYRYIKTR